MWLYHPHEKRWYENKGCENTNHSTLESINDILGDYGQFFEHKDWLKFTAQGMPGYYDKNDVKKLIKELTAIHDRMGGPGGHPMDDKDIAENFDES